MFGHRYKIHAWKQRDMFERNPYIGTRIYFRKICDTCGCYKEIEDPSNYKLLDFNFPPAKK